MAVMDWTQDALCGNAKALADAGLQPDDWFLETRRVATAKAKDFCLDCPVMFLCRDRARDEGVPYGVFGGEDKNEREDWWATNGGRPTLFDDALALHLAPNREEESEDAAAFSVLDAHSLDEGLRVLSEG